MPARSVERAEDGGRAAAPAEPTWRGREETRRAGPAGSGARGGGARQEVSFGMRRRAASNGRRMVAGAAAPAGPTWRGREETRRAGPAGSGARGG